MTELTDKEIIKIAYEVQKATAADGYLFTLMFARSLLASQAKQAAPIEQITPENTDGVKPSSQDQPKGGA